MLFFFGGQPHFVEYLTTTTMDAGKSRSWSIFIGDDKSWAINSKKNSNNIKNNNKNANNNTTSSTAQGGGGSFKNRKTIGETGCF